MRSLRISLLRGVVLAALVGNFAAAQELNADFEALAQYEIGFDSAPLERLREAVSHSKDDAVLRADLEELLLRVIASENESEFARQFASKELYRVAGPASIERLKPLLVDEEDSYLARYVLQRMPGSAAESALVGVR